VLDDHAPVVNKTVTLRPDTSWYSEDHLALKRAKRSAERRMVKTNLMVDAVIFKDISDQGNAAINQCKAKYYSSKIPDCKGDSRALFAITKKLMGKEKEVILPAHTSKQQLAEDFSSYFEQKISKIREGLDSARASASLTLNVNEIDPPFNGNLLTSFRAATLQEIISIINRSPSKSCSLDPVPTSLLKSCVSEVAPHILKIVNRTLETGQVPDYFKHALVTPLLKKQNADPNDFKNYRPVSNLPNTSKYLEKIIAARLDEHLSLHDLHDPLQSAYKKKHSTETALICVHNDICHALDNGSAVVLIMLDLSAAFDTIDHHILLTRLSHHYGIQGDALKVIMSYLENRTQLVVIGGVSSSKKVLRYGMPQGSGH